MSQYLCVFNENFKETLLVTLSPQDILQYEESAPELFIHAFDGILTSAGHMVRTELAARHKAGSECNHSFSCFMRK
jgi:hypothetical protein